MDLDAKIALGEQELKQAVEQCQVWNERRLKAIGALELLAELKAEAAPPPLEG